MMILFLYNLPIYWMGLIVVGATLLVALVGYAIAARLALMRLDAEQRSLALTMMSIITTMNSLLLALAAVNVWESYNTASAITAGEATCARELALDLAGFNSASANAATHALRVYLDSVIHEEWPVMQQSLRAHPRTEARFMEMFALVSQLDPTNARQEILLGEILTRVNELAKLRQQRLLSLDVSMPGTLWAVILAVSIVSFLLLYVLPPSPYHVALIAGWAITLGLMLFFVLAVDRPYAGEISVSPTPYEATLEVMGSL